MASLHPSITELLDRLRLRIRTHLVLETLALVALLLIAIFWIGLATDWYIETSRNVRSVGWLLVAIAAGGVIAWWGIRRLCVPLGDERLAQLLEHHFPELGDQLSTAIDLSSTTEGMHDELVARTQREAADTAAGFREWRALNDAKLRRLGGGALAGVLSIFALAIFAPGVWSVFTQRLALADTPWPRSVELSIDDFARDAEGRWARKVARNDDVALRVKALLTDGLRDPKRVQIRYRWQSGGRGRDEFIRIGNAEASGSTTQEYAYQFERIADTVDFEIRGGDGRIRPLRLEVVERPKVVELAIEVDYPDYLDRGDRTLEVGPRIELPEGTQGVVVGRTNKPLKSVDVAASFEDIEAIATVRDHDFRVVLPKLIDDGSLKIELVDEDGIGSREPFTVAISTRRDELPQVSALRDGIGTAATVVAQLPLEIEITDDNRLADAWVCMSTAQMPARKISLTGGRKLAAALATREVIDLRALRSADSDDPFDLSVGDLLTIEVAARDAYDLAGEPHIGTARKIQIEIVSEEELLARLARSELNLRQTFEAIADKLIVMYDDLEKLAPIAPNDAGLGSANGATAMQVVDTEEQPTPASGFFELDLAKSRLTETARQLSTETLGVGEGFREVYDQLQNNRVENEELLDRIGNRIAEPLARLGDELTSKVAASIEAVSDEPSTRSAARRATQQAVGDAEAILREMQGLENYNEVIALLRELINQQNDLSEKTKEEQKNQLRDLLLE